MKRILAFGVATCFALMMMGCGDNMFGGNEGDTKILNVIEMGDVVLADTDGDGTFETIFSKGELELLEADGWEIRIDSEAHVGGGGA